MTTRRLFICSLLVFFFAGFSKDADAQKNVDTRPNIIFILTDDLGWGDIGVFYQNQRAQARDKGEPWMFTPNLDKMAADGAKLMHHYAAAPVCAPSRASILLGVSQGHANVRDNQFDKALEDNYTIASVLREAGYATAAIGKWGLQGGNRSGTVWPAHPLNRGFDYFFGYMRHRDGHEHYPKEGIYRETKEVWDGRTNITNDLDKCYTADLWTAAAKKWILDYNKVKKKDSPFFLFLAFDTPHAVLELPTQEYPSGGGLKGGLQWLGEPGHMINTATGKIDSWIHPDYTRATYDHDRSPSTPEAPWPETYKRYATAVRRIDSAVGDIRQLLRDLNIDSNTIVVFTSDNGPSMESYLPENYVMNNPDFFDSFGPFDGIKRDCWEGGLRTPTLAVWPGRIPGNRIVDDPSASYDWLPTFTDAARISAPARTDGVSLIPSLTGTGKQDEGLVYVEYFHNGVTPPFEEFDPVRQKRRRNQMQMIRIADYVGVRYDIKSHADNFEIYDAVKDPGQSTNLAGRDGMKSLQAQMKARVLQVRRPDPSAPRPYDDELVPAIVNDNATNEGVRWSAYRGNFSWVPDLRAVKPIASGNADQMDIKAIGKQENGAVVFEGFLSIPTDGEYTFYLRTDGAALFRIHQSLVIDADYGYEGGIEHKGTIRLKAGLHPFKLQCLIDSVGKPLLNFQWEGPGIDRQEVPQNVLFYSQR